MRRNVMNDRRWMDGWPLVYDAVTQKKLTMKKRRRRRKCFSWFPFLLLTHSFSLSLSSLLSEEKERKRKAKVILSTWNKSTWFLLSFFFFFFTIYNQTKKERKSTLYAEQNFRFWCCPLFFSFFEEFNRMWDYRGINLRL
jgi:hypothetical protein